MELVIQIDKRLTEHERLEAVLYVRREFYIKTGKRFDKIRMYDSQQAGIFATTEGYDLSNYGQQAWRKYRAGDFAEPQASIDDRKGNNC